mgnify:CR=1 FL=1
MNAFSTNIPGYEIIRELGVGGMANVYLAVQRSLDRKVAIKVMKRNIDDLEKFERRFLVEGRTMAKLPHRNIVAVYDIVKNDEVTYIAMEYLEGGTLSTHMKEGLSLADAISVVVQIAQALQFAHEHGIVHRDLKPANLFLSFPSDGPARVKVLDFGIARIADGLPQPLRTRVGVTLGTTPYMPPEQIKGLSIDARADLFAVGATMFRLIARRRLHEAANESDLLVKMASLPAPALCSVAPEAPRDLGLVVDRALMFRRELRYPDALTMQADVRALRAGAPPPHATARLLEPDPPPEPPSLPATPWGSGEHAPLIERTAAASPGARGKSADELTPATISPRKRPDRPAAELPTQPERAAPAPTPREPPASAAIGVEASLPTPPLADTASGVLPLPVPSLSSPSLRRLSDDHPPATGPEPTLKSPGSAGEATPAPAPVAVQVVAPPPAARAAWPVTRTLPAGELPPMPAVRPPPRRRAQWLRIAFVAAFFMLLGVTLTLAWTLHSRSRGPRPSDAAANPSIEAPDPQSDEPSADGGLRPGFADPRPKAPAPTHGKGKGKGK